MATKKQAAQKAKKPVIDHSLPGTVPAHYLDNPQHLSPVQRRIYGGAASESKSSAKKATVTRLDGKKMKRGKDGLIHGDKVKHPKGRRVPKLGAAKPGEPLVTGTAKD